MFNYNNNVIWQFRPHRSNLISRKLRESLVQTLDGGEWRSVNGRALAYTTSDRTA